MVIKKYRYASLRIPKKLKNITSKISMYTLCTPINEFE